MVVIFQRGVMKKIVALAAAIAALASVNSANAADMPTKAPVYKAAPMAMYNWGGWYVGGNVGYGWGTNSDPNVTFFDGSGIGVAAYFAAGGNVMPSVQQKGVIGGLQLGYNWMLSPTWLVGLVTDFQGSGMKGSATNSFTCAVCSASLQSNSVQTDWFGTVRGKLGYAQNNWLLYATGGLAYGQVKSSGSYVFANGLNYAGSVSTTRAGWAAGAGIDYGLTPNWTVGVEYLYVDLGHVSYTDASTNGLAPFTTFTISNHATANIARATLNYKF
jgi:outer membrane immunogenic protein